MGGTARESGSGEGIQHFNAVRYRVTGTGFLKSKFYSLDDEFTDTLADLPMREKSAIEPTIPCNVISQRVALEISTVNINEYFKINRIIIFSKEIFTSFPE